MKASELLAEVEAEEKLMQRGWKKELCYLCEGEGLIHHAVNYQSKKVVKNLDMPISPAECPVCHGRGGDWIKPFGKHPICGAPIGFGLYE